MFYPAELEVRKARDGREIHGRFPYGKLAVLSDGGKSGRPVKERFKPGAFDYAIKLPELDISLLFGHDFGKPLASKKTGTLRFLDTAAALTFTAFIAAELLDLDYVKQTFALIGTGLAVGLSPGFRVPPKETVPDAETVEDEDPKLGRAIIRTLSAVVLYELSVVTRPAYKDATVEARAMQDYLVSTRPECQHGVSESLPVLGTSRPAASPIWWYR